MTGKEMEKGFQEIWKLFKETDEKFKETDKKFKETDKRLDKRFKKTEEEIEKTSKTVEETSKGLAEMRKTMNDLTGKWGRFVEGLIIPAAERLFKERGIVVNQVHQRVKVRRNGNVMEIDIMALNGEYVVLIEAKSTLKVEDVKDHIDRLESFKKFFPEYQGLKVIGAVGGIVIEEESDKYAYRNGLFVIGESGETVVILNDIKFRPKTW